MNTSIKPKAKSRELASRVLHAGLAVVNTKGGSLSLKDIKEHVLKNISLDEWATEIIESNGLPRWETYLHFFSIDAAKAGFLEKGKGIWTITPSGKEAIKMPPWEFLNAATEGYKIWKNSQVPSTSKIQDEATEDLVPDSPPEEQMLLIQSTSNGLLSADLLERLKNMTWQEFERVVVRVLIGMGYGGSRKEAGQALQTSGDEGIDGIINEDRLGLDVIYIQAKKWTDNPVGRPEIQKFVGALAGKQASKGIFITTTKFSAEAKEYAKNISQRVILLDGERLASLMIEHNIGVSTLHTFSIKRIDNDFFDEE